MMRLTTILALMTIGVRAMGQNVLSNADFSAHSACPTGLSQINLCTNWYDPNAAGSSDYYHQCATPPGPWGFDARVPSNGFGYQPSPSNAYVGFYTYCGTLAPANAREYVATTFPALQLGATYKVTIRISLADSVGYACDGFGVYFSTHAVHYPFAYSLPFTPQVDYTSYGVINDKTNWVTLSANFVADSAYAALIIAAFKNDADQHRVASTFSSTTFSSASYYYMDSASVERISGPPLATAMSSKRATTLYPNPMNRQGILSFESNGDKHHLYIYDIQGRLVRQINDITTNDVIIDRGDLMPGFYYYKLYEGQNIVCSDRFVIESTNL